MERNITTFNPSFFTFALVNAKKKSCCCTATHANEKLILYWAIQGKNLWNSAFASHAHVRAHIHPPTAPGTSVWGLVFWQATRDGICAPSPVGYLCILWLLCKVAPGVSVCTCIVSQWRASTLNQTRKLMGKTVDISFTPTPGPDPTTGQKEKRKASWPSLYF